MKRLQQRISMNAVKKDQEKTTTENGYKTTIENVYDNTSIENFYDNTSIENVCN